MKEKSKRVVFIREGKSEAESFLIVQSVEVRSGAALLNSILLTR
jgi:hypothetical protein